ncbi:hypothetical protein ES705_47100 [subsurface metagenome]
MVGLELLAVDVPRGAVAGVVVGEDALVVRLDWRGGGLAGDVVEGGLRGAEPAPRGGGALEGVLAVRFLAVPGEGVREGVPGLDLVEVPLGTEEGEGGVHVDDAALVVLALLAEGHVIVDVHSHVAEDVGGEREGPVLVGAGGGVVVGEEGGTVVLVYAPLHPVADDEAVEGSVGVACLDHVLLHALGGEAGDGGEEEGRGRAELGPGGCVPCRPVTGAVEEPDLGGQPAGVSQDSVHGGEVLAHQGGGFGGGVGRCHVLLRHVVVFVAVDVEAGHHVPPGEGGASDHVVVGGLVGGGEGGRLLGDVTELSSCTGDGVGAWPLGGPGPRADYGEVTPVVEVQGAAQLAYDGLGGHGAEDGHGQAAGTPE